MSIILLCTISQDFHQHPLEEHTHHTLNFANNIQTLILLTPVQLVLITLSWPVWLLAKYGWVGEYSTNNVIWSDVSWNTPDTESSMVDLDLTWHVKVNHATFACIWTRHTYLICCCSDLQDCLTLGAYWHAQSKLIRFFKFPPTYFILIEVWATENQIHMAQPSTGGHCKLLKCMGHSRSMQSIPGSTSAAVPLNH